MMKGGDDGEALGILYNSFQLVGASPVCIVPLQPSIYCLLSLYTVYCTLYRVRFKKRCFTINMERGLFMFKSVLNVICGLDVSNILI